MQTDQTLKVQCDGEHTADQIGANQVEGLERTGPPLDEPTAVRDVEDPGVREVEAVAVAQSAAMNADSNVDGFVAKKL